MFEYRTWGLEDAASALLGASPQAIAAVVAPPPASAVVVGQAPETKVPEAETREDSDLEGLYSPLPAGQEEMSNTLKAMDANEEEELDYSSDSRNDEEGNLEEGEQGEQTLR
jgi:hypothetical protein